MKIKYAYIYVSIPTHQKLNEGLSTQQTRTHTQHTAHTQRNVHTRIAVVYTRIVVSVAVVVVVLLLLWPSKAWSRPQTGDGRGIQMDGKVSILDVMKKLEHAYIYMSTPTHAHKQHTHSTQE